eukprot:CAMPEP_0118640308 /NCGR_PEP_ID=MMETSP0785-20121206/4686_1 /TAXON_ID=91992 /ORGANISM="Bolidomonas pacifica, Strain CCMP 1866" /LENGTH=628 /DNA_ID=CAMNT_0006531691 /DNA_START=320 /DNA_END=2202 /DNA_ORIENTATION=+
MSDTNSVNELDSYINLEGLTPQPSDPVESNPVDPKADLVNIREALLSIDYGSLEDGDDDDDVYDDVLGENREKEAAPQRWRGVSAAGAPSYKYGEYYGPTSSSSTSLNLNFDGTGESKGGGGFEDDFVAGEEDYEASYMSLKSYRPSPSAPSPSRSSSNTAVLQSMRAMQQKLRKMEQERAVALKQCSELSEISRSNVESLGEVREAEVRAGHDARRRLRVECDRRRNEKEEVEIRGVKVKERKIKAEEELEAWRRKGREEKLKRDRALGQLERTGETNETLEKEVGAIAGEEKRIIEVLESIRKDVKTEEDELRVKIEVAERELAKSRDLRMKGEAKKKDVDGFLSVVLTLNQELVGASSSPQKTERSRRDAYEVRDDGTFEAGGKAGERAWRANVGLEADRLLDWNGRKTGDSLGRVMEDVYQRLMRDREGIVMDDSSKSVRSEDVREAYKGGLLGRMGMVKLAGESLETARMAERLNVDNDDTPNSKYYDADDGSIGDRSNAVARNIIEEALTPPRKRKEGREGAAGFQSPGKGLMDARDMMVEEFTNLNMQYFDMVERAKGGKDGNIQDLLAVISSLQSKGEQLKLMGKTLEGRGMRIPVYSPDAVERKANALGILREYREQTL